MNKTIIILLFSFVAMFQPDQEIGFNDLLIKDKYLYALTPSGEIRIFDKINLNEINTKINNSSKIVAILLDNTGNLIIADKQNEIKRYNELNNSWEVISKYKNDLNDMCLIVKTPHIQLLTRV